MGNWSDVPARPARLYPRLVAAPAPAPAEQQVVKATATDGQVAAATQALGRRNEEELYRFFVEELERLKQEREARR